MKKFIENHLITPVNIFTVVIIFAVCIFIAVYFKTQGYTIFVPAFVIPIFASLFAVDSIYKIWI